MLNLPVAKGFACPRCGAPCEIKAAHTLLPQHRMWTCTKDASHRFVPGIAEIVARFAPKSEE